MVAFVIKFFQHPFIPQNNPTGRANDIKNDPFCLLMTPPLMLDSSLLDINFIFIYRGQTKLAFHNGFLLLIV